MNQQYSNNTMPRPSARSEMIKILSSVGEKPQNHSFFPNPALDAVKVDTAEVTQKVGCNGRRQKSVRFDTVEIREYPYVLGDNPSVSAGPPLSIGWEPQDEFTVGFDEYEAGKPTRPRDIYEMRLDETLRLLILQSSGYTIEEIAQAAIDVRIIQHHREETAQSSLRAQRFQQTKNALRSKLPRFAFIGGQSFGNKGDFSGSSSLPLPAPLPPPPPLKKSPTMGDMAGLIHHANNNLGALNECNIIPTNKTYANPQA